MRQRTGMLTLLVTLAGCGGFASSSTLYPTTGQVILADGRPLTEGAVRFIPVAAGQPATGTIGSDGKFSLRTRDQEGAAAGDYKVRIDPSPGLLKKGVAKSKIPFAVKYRNYEGDTGLTATVESGPTQLEPFRLEAK